MFYILKLVKKLDIHPRSFGKNLREVIHEKLVQEVEGTCNSKYGYVIAVTKVDSIGEGLIRQDGTGLATFSVHYSAVVSRPFKGEVVDCVVATVNKMGFFADAGPMQIFVSNHLISDELEFNATGDPSYQEHTEVRVRIVGIKIDQSDIFCIGTIKEDYLGVLSGPL
ncbi:uncharacterized protein HaLaN_04753, partial [Haematococcus lacustris]